MRNWLENGNWKGWLLVAVMGALAGLAVAQAAHWAQAPRSSQQEEESEPAITFES